MVARGEVWWYEDARVGRRPFLILTRDEAIPVLNQVLAVPVTRTIGRIPTEVALGRNDGMPTECLLSLDNVVPRPPRAVHNPDHPAGAGGHGQGVRGARSRHVLLTAGPTGVIPHRPGDVK